MDEVSNIIWQVKRPRYAHMAKYHELRGEYFEADYNYNMLLEAQKRTLGESHPDLAFKLRTDLERLSSENAPTGTERMSAEEEAVMRDRLEQLGYLD